MNQQEVDEKEVQVRSMYQVYFNARQVIIFAGEPTTPVRHWDPQAAFEIATKLARVEKAELNLDLRKIPIKDYRGFLSLPGLRPGVVQRRLGFPRPGSKNYTALRLIFTLPWFTRMWVVQEAACAAKAIIVCGEHEMSWHDFMRGVDFGLRSGLFAPVHTGVMPPYVPDAAPRGSLSTAIQIYHLPLPSSSSTYRAPMELFQLLRHFHGCYASDPRDKVFALLGLASLPSMAALAAELDGFDVRVDYRVEVSVLFQKLAQSILKNSKCLDLLSIPSCRADGPSWVPDWSVVNRHTKSLSYTTAAPTYRSAKDSEAHPEFENNVLILNGLLVDRIATVVDRDITQRLRGVATVPISLSQEAKTPN